MDTRRDESQKVELLDLRAGDYYKTGQGFVTPVLRSFRKEFPFLKGDEQMARQDFFDRMLEGKVGNAAVNPDDVVALKLLAFELEGTKPTYETTNFLLLSTVAAALYAFKI